MFEAFKSILGSKKHSEDEVPPKTNVGEAVQVVHDSQAGPTASTLIVEKQSSLLGEPAAVAPVEPHAEEAPAVDAATEITDSPNETVTTTDELAEDSVTSLSPDEVRRAKLLERVSRGIFDNPEALVRNLENSGGYGRQPDYHTSSSASVDTYRAPDLSQDEASYDLTIVKLAPAVRATSSKTEMNLFRGFNVYLDALKEALASAEKIHGTWHLYLKAEALKLTVSDDQIEQIKTAIDAFEHNEPDVPANPSLRTEAVVPPPATKQSVQSRDVFSLIDSGVTPPSFTLSEEGTPPESQPEIVDGLSASVDAIEQRNPSIEPIQIAQPAMEGSEVQESEVDPAPQFTEFTSNESNRPESEIHAHDITDISFDPQVVTGTDGPELILDARNPKDRYGIDEMSDALYYSREENGKIILFFPGEKSDLYLLITKEQYQKIAAVIDAFYSQDENLSSPEIENLTTLQCKPIFIDGKYPSLKFDQDNPSKAYEYDLQYFIASLRMATQQENGEWQIPHVDELVLSRPPYHFLLITEQQKMLLEKVIADYTPNSQLAKSAQTPTKEHQSAANSATQATGEVDRVKLSPPSDNSLIASETPNQFDLSGSGTPQNYELLQSVEQAIDGSRLTDSQKKWLKRLTLGATATLLALLLKTTITDRETSSSVYPHESRYSLLERHRQGWFSTPLIDQTQHPASIEYPLTLPKPVPDGTQALTSPVASQLPEGHSSNPQPPEGKSGKDTAQTATFENSHPWNEFIKTVESLGFSDKKVKIADGIKNALNALNTVINGEFKPDSIHQGVVTAVLSDSAASLVELRKLAETLSGKPVMFKVEQQKQLAKFIAAALSDTSNVVQEMQAFIQTLITSATDEQSNEEIAKSIVENYPSKLEELLRVLTAHGSTESTEQPTAVRGSMTFEQ